MWLVQIELHHIKNTPDFKELIQEKSLKYLIYTYSTDFMLKWHFEYNGLNRWLKLISPIFFYFFNVATRKS